MQRRALSAVEVERLRQQLRLRGMPVGWPYPQLWRRGWLAPPLPFMNPVVGAAVLALAFAPIDFMFSMRIPEVGTGLLLVIGVLILASRSSDLRPPDEPLRRHAFALVLAIIAILAWLIWLRPTHWPTFAELRQTVISVLAQCSSLFWYTVCLWPYRRAEPKLSTWPDFIATALIAEAF